MLKRIMVGLLAALMCAMLLFAGGCEREGLDVGEDSEFETGEAADSVYDLSLFSSCG